MTFQAMTIDQIVNFAMAGKTSVAFVRKVPSEKVTQFWPGMGLSFRPGEVFYAAVAADGQLIALVDSYEAAEGWIYNTNLVPVGLQ